MIAQAYTTFFKELEQNNHRDWFKANKKRYETDVKEPFYELLDQLIPQLKSLEPEISGTTKEAVFRINRDIRFSKDKTPYNTLMKAGFAIGGRKSQWPGYYLGISSQHLHIGGGLFNVKGPELKAVRELIAGNVSEFKDLVDDPNFQETFGGLQGDRAKRLDKSLHEAWNQTEYLANKQFYAMAQIPISKHLGKPNLDELVMDYFTQVNPLNQFLKRAF